LFNTKWYDVLQIDTGVVEFDDFLKIVFEHRSTENTPNEILAAFRLYDTQRQGFIDAKRLRYILTNIGEKLTDKDGKKIKEK
jgi:calmodulin